MLSARSPRRTYASQHRRVAQRTRPAQSGLPCRSGVTPVNMHESFAPYEAVVTSNPSASTRPLSPGLLLRVTAWVKSCADYYAAATAYEKLSRLSDAELKRLGLSRDILARDL